MNETIIEGWWLNIAVMAVPVILTVVGYYAKKLMNKLADKLSFEEAEREALDALYEGMALAQNEIVRNAKAASVDGRLTQQEIRDAEVMALNHAKSVVTGAGKDMVMSWSKRKVSSIIKQLLAAVK